MSDPYEPPLAPVDVRPIVAEVRPGRPRWVALRWVPLVWCGLTALACVGLGGMQLFLLGRIAWTGGYGEHGVPPVLRLFVASFPASLALAFLGWQAVRSWHRCRWRRACWQTFAFFALCKSFTVGFDFIKTRLH